MNMTVLVGPEGSSELPDTSDDNPARSYYKRLLSRMKKKHQLPNDNTIEYTSITRTLERFSLITHLIFLYKRRNFSKKEYIRLSLLPNSTIIKELQRKKLISDLDF